jgi:prepilin peptidase CpaA
MISSATAAIVPSLALSACALGWAAVSDIRHYIIPNKIPVIVTAAFIVAAFFMPLQFMLGGFLTGLAILAIGAFFFARGWMGGGDVKLLAAVSLWAGPSFLSTFAVVTGLSGAVLAAVMLSPLRRYMPMASADALTMTGPAQEPMPYGVAIAAGGLFVLALYLPPLFLPPLQ